jgi:DNA-binding NarL/FixJ family response regulator
VTSALLASDRDSAPLGDLVAQTVRRIVLIDPRPERRAITSMFVERSAALTVVGLAAGFADAEALIRAEHADAAVVEIQMPVAEGLAAIAAVRNAFPGLRIVVCSFRDDVATRDAARALGADGYLIKPLEVSALVDLVASSAPFGAGSRASAGACEPGVPEQLEQLADAPLTSELLTER